MRPQAFIAIIGGILLIVGAWGLFSTVDGDGRTTDYGALGTSTPTVACGTAFTGYDQTRQAYRGPTNCADAVSSRQMWAWPVAAVGVIALAGGLLVKPRPRREQDADA